MNEKSTLKDAVQPGSLLKLKASLKQEHTASPKKTLKELEAAREKKPSKLPT